MDAEPTFTSKQEVSSTLKPVLTQLSRKYSPVRSMLCLSRLRMKLMSAAEHDQRIYVHEEGQWQIKGRFSVATEEDEKVLWVMDGQHMVLRLVAVGFFPLIGLQAPADQCNRNLMSPQCLRSMTCHLLSRPMTCPLTSLLRYPFPCT
jgi:hypothetical protein